MARGNCADPQPVITEMLGDISLDRLPLVIGATRDAAFVAARRGLRAARAAIHLQDLLANPQSGGYVSCFCQTENGATGGCYLKLYDGVNCVPSGNGACAGACTIKLAAPPPPAPNP